MLPFNVIIFLKFNLSSFNNLTQIENTTVLSFVVKKVANIDKKVSNVAFV